MPLRSISSRVIAQTLSHHCRGSSSAQPGWRDKAGQAWQADLVLQACDEIRVHLDSWDAEDDFEDDDDTHDGDWDTDTD